MGNRHRKERQSIMAVLVKSGFTVVLIGFLGFISFAYLADLTPGAKELVVPVTLNAD
jgi:hypothetical protein